MPRQARHRRRVVQCGSSSQELRLVGFGVADHVPWINPVRAWCLVQLFEILAGALDGEGAQIVLELRLGPRAYEDAGRLWASKKPSERHSGMSGFMLFRNSADHVEQIPVLLVVQGREIILIYVLGEIPPAPFGRAGIFRIESPARGEPKRERRAQ